MQYFNVHLFTRRPHDWKIGYPDYSFRPENAARDIPLVCPIFNQFFPSLTHSREKYEARLKETNFPTVRQIRSTVQKNAVTRFPPGFDRPQFVIAPLRLTDRVLTLCQKYDNPKFLGSFAEFRPCCIYDVYHLDPRRIRIYLLSDQQTVTFFTCYPRRHVEVPPPRFAGSTC